MDPISSTPAPAAAPRSPANATIAWFRDLCLSVLIAIVVILFLYQPVKVEGVSMMPSLIDQERLFINKFSYRFGLSDVSRGDMVVFWFPGDPTKSYIKRVIGVPGDSVEVKDGIVVVNGEPLAESYVPSYYRDRISTARRVIPPQQYFVLGDHRSSSNDSRTWGLVPRHFIYGKAVFVYWPLDRIGFLH
ncbi:MAG: signal peptidase I [Bryobacteraceae bacterium]